MLNILAGTAVLLTARLAGRDIDLREVLLQTPVVLAMHLLWESLMLLFIYHTVVGRYRLDFWRAIRWIHLPGRGKAFFFGGIGLAMSVTLLFQFLHTDKRLPIEELFSDPGSAYLLAAFGILVAPFVEEVIFRGFFYPVFERMWGVPLAVLLTALLFASIHAPQLSGGWLELSGILAVGMILSYARARTGSLIPPYLLHLGYNTTLFVLLYVSTDRFRAFEN
jgi:membrane protease YdiL (CAAX protease family)